MAKCSAIGTFCAKEIAFARKRKGSHLEVLSMRFKKIALASCLSLLVGTIVVPVSSAVNYHARTDSTTRMQLADGMPLPPPHKEVMSADGMPLPPPHASQTATNV